MLSFLRMSTDLYEGRMIMTKREIIKYFEAKGVEVKIDYIGYTIHRDYTIDRYDKAKCWRVAIYYIDSYDNERCSYDMFVYNSLSNVVDEIALFVSIYWNEKRKCLVF